MKKVLFLGLLYFPGTFLHELSHYLAARVLRVRVVSWSLLPKFSKNKIEFGRVVMLKVDPIRSMIIALFPLITGLLLSLGLVKLIIYFDGVPRIIFIYLLLCIVNMMVPSHEDFHVAKKGIFLITLLVALAILLKFFVISNL